MDNISMLMSYFAEYGRPLDTLLFFMALFFIHIRFRTIHTLIALISFLLMLIVQNSATYFLQGPSAEYSNTGEVISMIQPSQVYLYTVYSSMLFGFISTVSFFIFSLDSYRHR